MDIKEILTRIGFVRNDAKLSAKKLSESLNKSPQYIAQIESGRIVLRMDLLLQILNICNFPIERFFSANIYDYKEDTELKNLIQSLSTQQKKNLIEFIKNK